MGLFLWYITYLVFLIKHLASSKGAHLFSSVGRVQDLFPGISCSILRQFLSDNWSSALSPWSLLIETLRETLVEKTCNYWLFIQEKPDRWTNDWDVTKEDVVINVKSKTSELHEYRLKVYLFFKLIDKIFPLQVEKFGLKLSIVISLFAESSK